MQTQDNKLKAKQNSIVEQKEKYKNSYVQSNGVSSNQEKTSISDYDLFLNQNKTRLSSGFRMGGSIKQEKVSSFKKQRSIHNTEHQIMTSNNSDIIEEDEKESVRSFPSLKDFDHELNSYKKSGISSNYNNLNKT